MQYLVEDTRDGFRITLLDRFGTPRREIDEVGGHGPVEGAYAAAARGWTQARAAQVARQTGPVRDLKLDDCDGDAYRMVMARVRVVNRHGYVCWPQYVTCSWPGDKSDKRSLSDRIKAQARIGFPDASDVVILDAARVSRLAMDNA